MGLGSKCCPFYSIASLKLPVKQFSTAFHKFSTAFHKFSGRDDVGVILSRQSYSNLPNRILRSSSTRHRSRNGFRGHFSYTFRFVHRFIFYLDLAFIIRNTGELLIDLACTDINAFRWWALKIHRIQSREAKTPQLYWFQANLPRPKTVIFYPPFCNNETGILSKPLFKSIRTLTARFTSLFTFL